MPNVGEVLKSEISRLSKKAVRQHISPIQAAASGYRMQMAALKKQVQQLQREVAALHRASAHRTTAPADADGTAHRFSAKGLKSLRSRLGLSAADFGQLLKVGGQTIYNWENEKTSPRPAQVAALAELRKIGRREAAKRLEAPSGD